MNITEKAEKAIHKVEKLLGESWSEEQEKEARKIIEKAMVGAIKEVCKSSSKAVNVCCSADQDMAHKLNEEISRAKNAIIANLSSLR